MRSNITRRRSRERPTRLSIHDVARHHFILRASREDDGRASTASRARATRARVERVALGARSARTPRARRFVYVRRRPRLLLRLCARRERRCRVQHVNPVHAAAAGWETSVRDAGKDQLAERGRGGAVRRQARGDESRTSAGRQSEVMVTMNVNEWEGGFHRHARARCASTRDKEKEIS